MSLASRGLKLLRRWYYNILQQPTHRAYRHQLIEALEPRVLLSGDAGIIPDIGDYVWLDTNGNGIQDIDESGVPNVTVNLRDQSGYQLLDSIVTDQDGHYGFIGLDTAEYVIEVVLPEGFVFTDSSRGSDDQLDSNIEAFNGQSYSFFHIAGHHDTHIDAGLQQLVDIQGTALYFGDLTGQVIAGISNVPLEQSFPSFDVVYVSDIDVDLNIGTGLITGDNGFGLLVNTSDQAILETDLRDYHYHYGFDGGWTFGGQFVYNTYYMSDMLPGQAQGSVGASTQLLTTGLEPGETLIDVNAQFYNMQMGRDIPGIDGTYNVINTITFGNRTAQMPTTLHGSYSGIAGYTVNQIARVSAGIDLDYEQAVGSNGTFSINLPTGEAPLWMNAFLDVNGNGLLDDSEPYISTPTSYDDIIGGLSNITLIMGTPPTGSIGDRVWQDVNANGVQDAGEPGIADVTVNLLDDQGGILDSTLTNSDGGYLFNALPDGSYSVDFDLPANYQFSQANAGDDDSIDSDADALSGLVSTIQIINGTTAASVDAGMTKLGASISGLVWCDSDRDGVQENDESFIGNVTVNLLDEQGQLQNSTTTDDNGQYIFDNLLPDRYIVEFMPTLDRIFSDQNAGASVQLDSDVDPLTGQTAEIYISLGQTITNLDAGLTIDPEHAFEGTFELSDISSIIRDGAVFQGNGSSRTGQTLAPAGDVNGDGFADFLVGAPNDYDQARTEWYFGSTVLVYGQSAEYTGFQDLKDVTDGAFQGMYFYGIDFLDKTGASISSAGDVNGDGFDDLLIGAPYADANGSASGETYLVYGKQTGLTGAVNLAAIAAGELDGAVFYGIQSSDEQGYAVSNAGDLNHDGFDDLLLGSYLVYGKQTGLTGELNVSQVVSGELDGAVFVNDGGILRFSCDVSLAGDVNGDGELDLMFSNYSGTSGTTAGMTYLIFGQTDHFTGQINLDDIADGSVDGAILMGINASDYSGNEIAPAGDVNGDGFDDLLIGAYLADHHGDQTGEVYLVYGNASQLTGVLSLADLATGQLDGALFYGEAAGDKAGISVASAGDFNGDGFADLLIGAYYADTEVVDSGKAYLIYGHPTQLTGEISLATVGTQQLWGTVMEGFAESYYARSTYAGDAVSSAGDVNADGYDDILVGSIFAPALQESYYPGLQSYFGDAGAAYLIYGRGRSIVSHVWYDQNLNGIQDANESGLGGVTVSLLDTSLNILQTTTSLDDGTYVFQGLTADDYRIQFTASAGTVLTTQNVGDDDTVDSDANATTGLTELFTLGDVALIDDIDAGFYGTASISGTVWEDRDYNMWRGDAEPLLQGFEVALYDAADNLIDTTLSDAQGAYHFTNLVAGDYKVFFDLPANRHFVFYNYYNNDHDTVDSDIDPTNGWGPVVSLAVGQQVEHMDIGLQPSGRVEVDVWFDANGNGVFDSDESYAYGTKLYLSRTDGTRTLNTTLTNFTHMPFIMLSPGEYQLSVLPADGYMPTSQDQGGDDTIDSDIDPLTNHGAVFTITDGQILTGIGVGIVAVPPSSISDRVWIDSNNDGIQDVDELGAQGVTVNLLDDQGAQIATTLTDAQGLYLFDNVSVGDYRIEVVLPDGYGFSPENTGSDESLDSDILHATSRTGLITVGENMQLNDVDAGIVPLGSISGVAFGERTDNTQYDIADHSSLMLWFTWIPMTIPNSTGLTAMAMKSGTGVKENVGR